MPVDIYDKRFQNWLKGVLGLNETRLALCKCMSAKFEGYVKDIPSVELKQFFRCLNSNQIAQLKTQRKLVKTWECKHDRCKELMDLFVENHTEGGILGSKYVWKLNSRGSHDNTCHGKEENFIWNVIVFYMHIDKSEPGDDYTCLESLDISHIIKVMRNFKPLYFDGSAEIYQEVINSRNKLMHSPNNIMDEGETQNILKWARKLLDTLQISEETYYQDAVEYLQDLAEKDFVIKYQSEEYKKVLAEVLEAKEIADKLNEGIRKDDEECKRKSKQLLEKLGGIGGFGSFTEKSLEIKPTAYKSIVKDSLEMKQESIEHTSKHNQEKNQHQNTIKRRTNQQNTQQNLTKKRTN